MVLLVLEKSRDAAPDAQGAASGVIAVDAPRDHARHAVEMDDSRIVLVDLLVGNDLPKSRDLVGGVSLQAQRLRVVVRFGGSAAGYASGELAQTMSWLGSSEKPLAALFFLGFPSAFPAPPSSPREIRRFR